MNRTEQAMLSASTLAYCIAALSVLGACAVPSGPPMGQALAELSRQPRVHVLYHPPARVFTLENAVPTAVASLGPVPVVPVVLEGRQLARDLDLRDPVARVAERVAASLQAALGTANMLVTEFGGDDDPAVLERTLGGVTVLSVRTTQWGIAGDRAKYEARARLIDLSRSRSRILWEGRCAHLADAHSPPIQALAAREGDRLKAKLHEAADACAAQLAGLIRAGAAER
jgi:hypothetical protein